MSEVTLYLASCAGPWPPRINQPWSMKLLHIGHGPNHLCSTIVFFAPDFLRRSLAPENKSSKIDSNESFTSFGVSSLFRNLGFAEGI